MSSDVPSIDSYDSAHAGNPRPVAPRREHVEPENLFTGWHDVPLTRPGPSRGVSGGRAHGRRRPALRRRPHVGADSSRRHLPSRPRGDGPGVAAGAAPLAAQRASLRRVAGPRQEADHRAPRGRADQAVAAQLRRAAAARRRRQPRAPGERPALPAARSRRAPGHRMPRDVVARVLPYWHDVIAPAAARRARRARHRPWQLVARAC